MQNSSKSPPLNNPIAEARSDLKRALTHSYDLKTLRSDLLASLSVAAVAVPTAMAYAELAGFPPVIGLYSSILPLVAYACVGSSRQLIVGPDAATCTIVAAALVPLAAGDSARYLVLSITLSAIVGIMCIAAGLLRLGIVADFLSRPILTGFMNGIALTIITKQLGGLCGFAVPNNTGFFLRIANFCTRLGEVQTPTLAVGIVTLILIFACARLAPKIPGPLIGVVVGLMVAQVFDLEKSAVATVGTIPAGFPSPKFPEVTLDEIQALSLDALGVLVVSFCSEIATAKSFAARNGYKVDANRELIALGAANLASAASQGFAVSGADSRTAISDVSGGKTRMTAMYTAGLIALVLLFLTGPLSTVPKSSLAAILIIAGASLFDFAATRHLYRVSQREFWIANIATLGVITIGVGAGIIIAIVLTVTILLRELSRPHDAILGRIPGGEEYGDAAVHPGARAIPGLLIYRFDAAILFFNAEYFKERVRSVIAAGPTKISAFLFDAEAVTMIDTTAAFALDEIRTELDGSGISFFVTRARTALREQFARHGLFEGDAKTFYPSIRSAVDAFESTQPATVVSQN
ncbi:MAG TPA: SulP family inorganic anion transporter [Candidatus Binataceae bacterium]|nr:SulP family inorganic anion transporter [Candidatus Binataceae bacterium]